MRASGCFVHARPCAAKSFAVSHNLGALCCCVPSACTDGLVRSRTTCQPPQSQLCRGRFSTLKHGNAIFHEYGTCGAKREWRDDPALFQRWKDGATGMPLVDANMRELAATGMARAGKRVLHDPGCKEATLWLVGWKTSACW